VITLGDVSEPEIFLNGHLDVVAAQASQFTPFVEEDRLYGRGAYDMKAACAVMIALMKELSVMKLAKDRVGLMLVPDEEVGGFCGSAYLLGLGYKPKELFLAGEGTDFHIERETKGVLWIKLIAQGRASHAAYPWKGTNAILALSRSLQRLSMLYPTPVGDVWRTTSVVSKITGGASINVVPDYSEASLDIRYVAEDVPTQILERIRSVLEQEVRLEVILHEEPHDTYESSPALLQLQQLVKKIVGQDSIMQKKHGISDARFFSKEGIPSCGFGPIGGNHHQEDEYVELASLEAYYAVLKQLVLERR
jgi:succinyl-diaminopimelate desuccinylase